MGSEGSVRAVARSDAWRQRKKAKAYAGLQSKLSVALGEYFADHPTHVLCAVNGGHDGRGEEAALRGVFGRYGSLTHVVKMPGHAHAVVAYATVAEATAARDALHESPCAPLLEADRVLYIEYVRPDHLPADDGGRPDDVPGLRLRLDFISPAEEDALLALIGQQPWHELRRRRVQHYGYRFDYTTNAFDPDPARATPLPALFAELADRAYRLGLAPCVCDQLTINEYPPGGGISAHVDTHSPFEDGIVSVSLGAHTVLDFRHRDGAHVPVLIPRRSVFVMTGAARYDWTHAISQRKGDVIGGRFVPREARTSLTWRRIRTGPCPCAYPALCDAPASSTRAIIKAPQDQDHTISRLQTGQ